MKESERAKVDDGKTKEDQEPMEQDGPEKSAEEKSAVSEITKVLKDDEYLLENAAEARPLSLFDKPELLFSTSSTKDALDQVMKTIVTSLDANKTVGKCVKRSVEDFRKLRKSLDKARQQFAAKKAAAEKVSEGKAASSGRTSWAKMLTSEDYPLIQAAWFC